MTVLHELEQAREEALAAIAAASTLAELDTVRVAYLGKKGSLTGVLRGLGGLSAEERPAVGKTANEVRVALETALEERKRELSASALDERVAAEALDVTLPGRRREQGHEHLINRITREVTEIFVGLGYQVAEGPEVELDYYNYTALNTPADHPARSLADTFYVKDLSGDVAAVTGESDVLLRTQTSPVQVRYMECHAPPIYIIAPGKVYRRDIADPSHLPQFTQIEGLVVDEGITFGDLKGTLEQFVKALFGEERRTRLRPHFFPFTEPSAEVDVSCGICEGAGCRFCKGAGWLEILGCGMIDPAVYGFVGYDPEVYTGFAFGMGVERIAMLRHGISDIRLFFENDIRFLSQF